MPQVWGTGDENEFRVGRGGHFEIGKILEGKFSMNTRTTTLSHFPVQLSMHRLFIEELDLWLLKAFKICFPKECAS